MDVKQFKLTTPNDFIYNDLLNVLLDLQVIILGIELFKTIISPFYMYRKRKNMPIF